MFESALGRSEASSTRLGTGAILSAIAHGLVAALVFIVPGKTKAQTEPSPQTVIVEFVPPKVAGGGGSPEPAQQAPKAETPASHPKPTPTRIPDKPAPEPVQEPEPQPAATGPTGNDPAPTDGPSGGGAGGGSGSGSGGTGGNGPGTGNGSSEPAPTYTEINWNATMERPVLIAGPAQPEYPRNAMLQHREGTVIARCRITTDGSVRDCRIISGDVMLQDAALAAVTHQRYRPLMFNGAPASVWYMFRFTFKLQ